MPGHPSFVPSLFNAGFQGQQLGDRSFNRGLDRAQRGRQFRRGITEQRARDKAAKKERKKAASKAFQRQLMTIGIQTLVGAAGGAVAGAASAGTAAASTAGKAALEETGKAALSSGEIAAGEATAAAAGQGLGVAETAGEVARGSIPFSGTQAAGAAGDIASKVTPEAARFSQDVASPLIAPTERAASLGVAGGGASRSLARRGGDRGGGFVDQTPLLESPSRGEAAVTGAALGAAGGASGQNLLGPYISNLQSIPIINRRSLQQDRQFDLSNRRFEDLSESRELNRNALQQNRDLSRVDSLRREGNLEANRGRIDVDRGRRFDLSKRNAEETSLNRDRMATASERRNEIMASRGDAGRGFGSGNFMSEQEFKQRTVPFLTEIDAFKDDPVAGDRRHQLIEQMLGSLRQRNANPADIQELIDYAVANYNYRPRQREERNSFVRE